MENILIFFVFIVGIIVVTSIVNEKKLHIQQDIALVIVSFMLSVAIIVLQNLGLLNGWVNKEYLMNFKFDSFLLECTLCFMLFAGASKVHLNKFINNAVPIAYLSILTTIISSVIYGALFFGINILLGLNLDIWVCILLGCIISPTDPIAATGILNKFGISKSLLSTIEGESLFNDGVGVSLFVFVSSIIQSGNTENFFLLMFKEIFGAFAIGLAVSWILFKLIKHTNEPIVHILISLLTVSLSYVICEHIGFSGVIASVVCGMYFSYQNKKIRRWKEVVDPNELYNDFWSVVENLLNSVLFVLVGFSVFSMEFNGLTLLLIPIAVLINLLARAVGVGTATKLIGKKKIPSRYSFKEFVILMTWCGLKGGVSLALVMSTKGMIDEPKYAILLNVTMITILFTTIVQGMITKNVYKYIEKKRDEVSIQVVS